MLVTAGSNPAGPTFEISANDFFDGDLLGTNLVPLQALGKRPRPFKSGAAQGGSEELRFDARRAGP